MPEPLRILDRAFIVVGHAHGVGGHVVHEEVREMLRRDDDQSVRPGPLKAIPQPAESRVERLADCRIGPVRPGGHARAVTR